MKKIIICFIFVLLLSGCVTNEDFNKTCKYNRKTSHIEDSTEINVTYDNKDTVKKAVVQKTYKALDDEGIEALKDIKEAINSYNNKYAGTDIEVALSSAENEKYSIKYYLNVLNLNEKILKEFEIEKNSIKFFNKMRQKNIECE